jgi:hypothetical protein
LTFRRAAAVAAAALALPAGAAAQRWSAPFRLAGPEAADLTLVQLAISPSGELAAGFSAYDEDQPAMSQASLSLRPARGGAARTDHLRGAGQILALTFSGEVPVLLAGTGAAGQPCCARADVVEQVDGRFSRPRTVADGLTGAATGELEPLPGGGVLAAVGTDRGVWAGPLGRVRQVGSGTSVPWVLAATPTSVGWLAAPDRLGQSGPHEILVAPLEARARDLFTAPSGHELDELALAPLGSGATAAWIDGWFDGSGSYHAQAVVADVGRTVRPRPLPVAGRAASGIMLAGGTTGDQVLAFKACDGQGLCSVWESFRPRGARFSAPAGLGSIDPGQEPAAAVTPDGTAVVGWISGGRVFAAWRPPRASRFTGAHPLSPTVYASDLTIAPGPGSEAVAAWTEGTLAPSIVAATLR